MRSHLSSERETGLRTLLDHLGSLAEIAGPTSKTSPWRSTDAGCSGHLGGSWGGCAGWGNTGVVPDLAAARQTAISPHLAGYADPLEHCDANA